MAPSTSATQCRGFRVSGFIVGRVQGFFKYFYCFLELKLRDVQALCQSPNPSNLSAAFVSGCGGPPSSATAVLP